MGPCLQYSCGRLSWLKPLFFYYGCWVACGYNMIGFGSVLGGTSRELLYDCDDGVLTV